MEPYYLPTPDGEKPNYTASRMDAEVLRTSLGGVNSKWYFNPKDYQLLCCEVSTDRDDDPCEIHFSDYRKDSQGRMLPGKMVVRYGDKEYLRATIDGWKMEEK